MFSKQDFLKNNTHTYPVSDQCGFYLLTNGTVSKLLVSVCSTPLEVGISSEREMEVMASKLNWVKQPISLKFSSKNLMCPLTSPVRINLQRKRQKNAYSS